jgi:hypothetical protein
MHSFILEAKSTIDTLSSVPKLRIILGLTETSFTSIGRMYGKMFDSKTGNKDKLKFPNLNNFRCTSAERLVSSKRPQTMQVSRE